MKIILSILQTPEIREKSNEQEIEPPVTVQVADSSTHMNISSGIPPLDSLVPTSESITSDTQTVLTSQPLVKRRRFDPRV